MLTLHFWQLWEIVLPPQPPTPLVDATAFKKLSRSVQVRDLLSKEIPKHHSPKVKGSFSWDAYTATAIQWQDTISPNPM